MNDLPWEAEVIYKAINSGDFAGRLFGMLTLYREINRETSQTTVHVSTDKTEGAGGRGAAYLYQIECPNPILYEWRTTPPSQRVGPPAAVSDTSALIAVTTKASLLTDTNNIDTASIIAVVSGNEVAFLTDVPLAWIRRYRERARTGWTPM